MWLFVIWKLANDEVKFIMYTYNKHIVFFYLNIKKWNR